MSNRFKCLFDEEQPARERPRRKTREHDRERRPITVNHFRVKEIEKEKQQKKIENNETNFPSLVEDNKGTKTNPIEVSYDSILKNEEKSEKSEKKKSKTDKLFKKGWIQLGVKYEPEPEPEPYFKVQTKEDNLNEYLHFIDCMVNLYEHQKLEKIEILEEDNFERIYKFQNYDYEYFEKLDEKYEDKLEAEMKKYEKELYGYNSDNSM